MAKIELDAVNGGAVNTADLMYQNYTLPSYSLHDNISFLEVIEE